MDQQSNERVVVMSTTEQRSRRRAAVITTGIALVLVALAAIMVFGVIGVSAPDMQGVAIAFFCFFTAIAAFIIAVSLRDGFNTKKIVITGTVTSKRIDTRFSTGSSNTSTYVIGIDGQERIVELHIYNRVHVGDRIELSVGAALRSSLDVAIVDAPVPELTAEECDVIVTMEPSHRRFLWKRLVRTLVWRVPLIFVVTMIANLGALLAIQALIDRGVNALAAFSTIESILLGLVAIIVLRWPWKLVRDLMDGRVTYARRLVTDVIDSNRPLAGPTTVVLTRYNAGTYQYVRAGEFFLPAASIADTTAIRIGSPVTVVVLPHAGIVVGTA